MVNPVSTYRLQFHSGFTFRDLEKKLSYLHQLGIKTIYASPIFEAVPGSVHGYDALNPNEINPEIGTPEQLQNLSSRLKENGMFWLQDIVPNHMAFDTRNPWLMDVLEKGQHSVYASFFDAGWNNAEHKGKLMVPFLGDSLQNTIRKGELKLAYAEPRLVFRYFNAEYPLGLSSYRKVLQTEASGYQAVQELLLQIEQIHQAEEAAVFAKRFGEWQMQLTSLMKNERIRISINRMIDVINADASTLEQLIEAQVYRLCCWQETDQRINYRRFFTVNGLICLNMQDENIF